MEWTAEAKGRALQRMVALLLALADLAERAGAAPFPVRFIVLAILRHAEAVAWQFVAVAVPVPSRADVEAPVPCRDSRAEAVRLALGLRILALVVAELTAQAPARVSSARLRDFVILARAPLAHAPAALPAHDTS